MYVKIYLLIRQNVAMSESYDNPIPEEPIDDVIDKILHAGEPEAPTLDDLPVRASPERVMVYANIEDALRIDFLEEFGEIFREEFGDFDDADQLCESLLMFGSRMGSVHWERFETNDLPELMRERNFERSLLELAIRKETFFREWPYGEDDLDYLLEMICRLTVACIRNYEV